MDNSADQDLEHKVDECRHVDDKIIYSQKNHVLALQRLSELLDFPITTDFSLLHNGYKEFLRKNHPDKTMTLDHDDRHQKEERVKDVINAMNKLMIYNRLKSGQHTGTVSQLTRVTSCAGNQPESKGGPGSSGLGRAREPPSLWSSYWNANALPGTLCVLVLPEGLAHGLIPQFTNQNACFPKTISATSGFALCAVQEISWEARNRISGPLTVSRFMDLGFLFASRMNDIQLRAFADFLASAGCDLDIIVGLAASDVLPIIYEQDTEYVEKATAWITALFVNNRYDNAVVTAAEFGLSEFAVALARQFVYNDKTVNPRDGIPTGVGNETVRAFVQDRVGHFFRIEKHREDGLIRNSEQQYRCPFKNELVKLFPDHRNGLHVSCDSEFMDFLTFTSHMDIHKTRPEGVLIKGCADCGLPLLTEEDEFARFLFKELHKTSCAKPNKKFMRNWNPEGPLLYSPRRGTQLSDHCAGPFKIEQSFHNAADYVHVAVPSKFNDNDQLEIIFCCYQ